MSDTSTKEDGDLAHEISLRPSEGENMLERYYEDDDPLLNSQPLEVYMYYAAIEREREEADTRQIPDAPWSVAFKKCFGRGDKIVRATPVNGSRTSRKLRWRKGARKTPTDIVDDRDITPPVDGSEKGYPVDPQSLLTTQESETAYRLLRVASWQVVFFLITTDVLGWYTAPMAFAQLGFGPGVLVYTCFYLLAFGSGQILWRMYLAMDSAKYPVKCYADLGQRTYGRVVKHVFNVLQSIQLLFNVAMLLIMDGQALAQIIDYKFCYMALTVFFAILCMAIAQAKTLRGLSSFTTVNLFVNILVMTLTMVGVGLYDPVPSQSGHVDLSEPITTSAWVPDTTVGWYQQVTGVQLAVFAYGGAMIFTEFMSEMRRPRDFWKAALGAQMLCWLLYMFFGMFVYAFQGQYTNILPTVNISSTIFQGVTNILGLVCVCVIAILYAHIGCKVFYRNILRGYFKAPSLTSSKSTIYWCLTVIGYFALAWVLGSAIPNITDLNTIVGAACILQFTYTFPPMLLVGHWVQRDAIAGDNPWQPGIEPWSNRVDTWWCLSRWKRGFRRHWYAKITLICMSLGCLALCGLGIYSGVQTAKDSFASGYTTSYSCRAPGQPL